jgi:hypothetical protein
MRHLPVAFSSTTLFRDPSRPKRITTMVLAALVQAYAALGSLDAHASIVSDWNKTALLEVRQSTLRPPIVARVLAILHTCIDDAWSAYDPPAIGTRTACALSATLLRIHGS